MLAPLLSAIFGSIGGILDKFNLNQHKIEGKYYATFLFIGEAIVGFLLLFLTHAQNTVTPYSILILILIIAGSSLQNILFYSSLAKKDLSNLLPITNTEPIFVILIAFFIFPTERNWLVLLLASICAVALVYAHVEKEENNKHKLVIDKYFFIVLFSMLVAGFVHTGYRIALEYYSPIALSSLRVIGVAFVLGLLYKPKVSQLQKKQGLLVFLSALLYMIAGVIKNYSITKIGISQTALIIMISPAMVYICSRFFLKERFSIHKVFASSIIIACVIVALVYLH